MMVTTFAFWEPLALFQIRNDQKQILFTFLDLLSDFRFSYALKLEIVLENAVPQFF